MTTETQKESADENRDEEMVRALRGLLVDEAPVPLGLRSRLEAEVAGAHLEDRQRGWTATLVLGALLFSVGAFVVPTQLSGEVLGLLAVGALGYAVSLRSIGGRRQG